MSLDVAFAMGQYGDVTRDELFFRQHVWPVIKGVAEWVASRVKRTGRGFEMRHLTGIDEIVSNINNDAETNALAAIVLRQATAYALRLGFESPVRWTEIADRMFIPIDPESRIVPKNDTHDLGQDKGCADVMMLTFPFDCPLDPDVREATVRYNIERADTYLGMPMNCSNYAVWASRADEREKALAFLETGVMDLVEMSFWQTVESNQAPFAEALPKTVFVTKCGAHLTAILQGMTGLQFNGGDPQTWGKYPVALPQGWEAIEVERVWVRGAPMRLTARHGEAKARLETLESA